MRINECGYMLAPVVESIRTPEEARNLSDSALGGIRATIDDVMHVLCSAEGAEEFNVEKSLYKLSMIAALLDAEERASDFAHDVWSGIRIIIKEVTEVLLSMDPTPQAC